MCGVFGIAGHEDAVTLTCEALQGLQHRGQESCGIASFDDGHIQVLVGMGLVSENVKPHKVKGITGDTAIGHVRYSTAGSSALINAQPIKAQTSKGRIAISHNGNLVNNEKIHAQLVGSGAIFAGNSDTEVILHLVARSRARKIEDAVLDALSKVEGAYSMTILLPGRVMAVRDPRGFRPLFLGQKDNSYCFASEPSAFRLIQAETLREVKPGEILIASGQNLQVIPWQTDEPTKFCIFEHVYFSRPDSVIMEKSVAAARRRFGHRLAEEQPAEADIVVPIPDSGVFAALGYAERANIPLEFALIRAHHVGRTFIQPDQSTRRSGVYQKLAPVSHLLKDARVALIDDSIVRGTTMNQIVNMIRDAGAREIHVRISCPPIRHSCFYGIDTPKTEELIAHNMSVEEICGFIEADSLGYLSLDGMLEAMGGKNYYCTACWDGNYPVGFDGEKQISLFSSEREFEGG